MDGISRLSTAQSQILSWIGTFTGMLIGLPQLVKMVRTYGLVKAARGLLLPKVLAAGKVWRLVIGEW